MGADCASENGMKSDMPDRTGLGCETIESCQPRIAEAP